jgi:uncharacterized damage-inducible protein DinB
MRLSHTALTEAVRRLQDDALFEKIRGLDYSAATLLSGVIEHGSYHGGQIALLKRALARSGS